MADGSPSIESPVAMVARLGFSLRPEDERRLVSALLQRDIAWGRRVGAMNSALERLRRVVIVARDISHAAGRPYPGERLPTMPAAMFVHLATELDHLWSDDVPREGEPIPKRR